MTNPTNQTGKLPTIIPSTLSYYSSSLGELWIRGLSAGGMFRVAERFPKLADADDNKLMHVVVEKSVAHDPACDQFLTKSESASLDHQDLAAIASMMCEIDEVDLPDGSEPISIYASFVKKQVKQISERSRSLLKSVGSSFFSPGTAGRIAQSYAEGVLSNRFINKASERASQLSALSSPSISIPVDTRPQRMESVARDTLDANLQILRRLSDIADVASDVEIDRAAQQVKDSRNLRIAVVSLGASVVLSLLTIWITYYGVRKADAASAESSRLYQQTIDIQRSQLAEAQSLSGTLREQLSALRDEIRSMQTIPGKSNPAGSSRSGVRHAARQAAH